MWIFHKIHSLFRSSQPSYGLDLEVVFGEKARPEQDPNQGTRFWTANDGHHITARLVWLLAAAGILVMVFGYQLWQLQIKQGEALALEGRYNTLSSRPLFAARGTIFDQSGNRLAWSSASTSRSYQLRQYASSTGLGHVLGYVSYPQADDQGNYFRTQTVGQAGVEAGYNDLLAATPGRKIFSTNAAQQVVSESVVREPQPGGNVRLSIDTAVQEKLYSLMERTTKERGFRGGAGVIMDVDSGELVAAASYPGFDPEQVMNNDQYLQELRSATTSPFLNRVSEGLYTPGSVVKPYVGAAALNEEVVTPATTIVSTGQMRIPNPYQPDMFTIFPDWKAHGPVQMREAIAVSSNVYFYQIGGGFEDQAGLGIDNIADYAKAFGLSQKTGIKGLSESAGVIPTPEWKRENFPDDIWRVGDTYNTAIGQYGFQVTPLQMVRSVAGIATAGKLPTPSLLQNSDADADNVGMDISRSDYQVVQEGMRRAVTTEQGTAHNLDVDFVDIAAKTGTAELGGEKSSLNSWITGYFPYQDPEYAFTIVMAEGPRSNVVGGLYVMRRLLDWMQQEDLEYVVD